MMQLDKVAKGRPLSLIMKLLMITIPIAVFGTFLGLAFLAPGIIPPGNIWFPQEGATQASMINVIAEGLANGALYAGITSGVEFAALKLTSSMQHASDLVSSDPMPLRSDPMPFGSDPMPFGSDPMPFGIREYVSKLTKVGFSKNEIATITSKMEALRNAGISNDDLAIVFRNITGKTSFGEEFLGMDTAKILERMRANAKFR